MKPHTFTFFAQSSILTLKMKRKSLDACSNLLESQLLHTKNEDECNSVLWCGPSDSRKGGLCLILAEVRQSAVRCNDDSVFSRHSHDCRHALEITEAGSHPRTDQRHHTVSWPAKRKVSASLSSISIVVDHTSSKDNRAEDRPFRKEKKASPRLSHQAHLSKDLASNKEPISDRKEPISDRSGPPGAEDSNGDIRIHAFQNLDICKNTDSDPWYKAQNSDDRYGKVRMLLNLFDPETPCHRDPSSPLIPPQPSWSSMSTEDEELALLFKYTHVIGGPEESPEQVPCL